MQNPSTPEIRNEFRGSQVMLSQSHDFIKSQKVTSSHGLNDLSVFTPVDDEAGNFGLLDDLFVHTSTASSQAGKSNPNALALRNKVYMVSGDDNGWGLAEWVRVQRSDGEYRFYPTVAF